MLSLISLPVDILIIILESLAYDDLSALSLSCNLLHSVVTDYGWTNYLRDHPRPSWSLTSARQSHWSPRARVYYDAMSDRGWESSKFIARPLSRMWAGKLQPVLAINESRLVVGAGSNLYSYTFDSSPNPSVSPPVKYEGTVSLLRDPERARNITAISFVSSASADGNTDTYNNTTLHVAFQDGATERVQLVPPTTEGDALTSIRSLLPSMPNGDFIESISSESDLVLYLSSTGHARLGPVSSLSSVSLSSSSSSSSSTSTSLPPPSSSSFSSIDLKTRSWASTLCLRASSPYAALGTASTTPLTIHTIHQDGQLSEHPTAILHTKQALSKDKLPSSAVYGLAQGPVNSPWGASPDVLVSGWYDGAVRCYDLRVSSIHTGLDLDLDLASPTSASSTRGRMHAPVLTLLDRWSYEPIYSVACGGGAGAHIAAGTARHSVVSFWDVRYCNTGHTDLSATTGGMNGSSGSSGQNSGWSVYAPGSDPSPVYSVVMESSRFFGVTQSRPFVYDFGPGVSLDTYPPIPQGKGIDNLKQKKGASRVTYHVLRREHNSAAVCSEH